MDCPHTYTTTKRANLRQIMTTAKKKTNTACLSKFVFVCISMHYSALRLSELLKKGRNSSFWFTCLKTNIFKRRQNYNGWKWIIQCSGLELVTLFPLCNIAAVSYIISIIMFSLLTAANMLLIIILFEWSHSRKDDIGSFLGLCHYACKGHLSLPTQHIFNRRGEYLIQI